MTALIWKELNFYKKKLSSIRSLFILGMFILLAFLDVKIDMLQLTSYMIACTSLFMYNVFLDEDYEILFSFKYTIKSVILVKNTCLFIVSLLMNLAFLVFYYVYKGLSFRFLTITLDHVGIVSIVVFFIMVYFSLLFMSTFLFLLGRKSSYITFIPLTVVLISNFLNFPYWINIILSLAFLLVSLVTVSNTTKEKVIRSMSL